MSQSKPVKATAGLKQLSPMPTIDQLLQANKNLQEANYALEQKIVANKALEKQLADTKSANIHALEHADERFNTLEESVLQNKEAIKAYIQERDEAYQTTEQAENNLAYFIDQMHQAVYRVNTDAIHELGYHLRLYTNAETCEVKLRLAPYEETRQQSSSSSSSTVSSSVQSIPHAKYYPSA